MTSRPFEQFHCGRRTGSKLSKGIVNVLRVNSPGVSPASCGDVQGLLKVQYYLVHSREYTPLAGAVRSATPVAKQ